MKILTKITIIFLFLIFVPVCLAQTQNARTLRTFQLNDGSTFQGILIGVRTSDGHYKIESPKLGTLYINPDDVRSMMTTNKSEIQEQAPAKVAISPSSIKDAQKMLMADPAVNQTIQELMLDPEILKLMQDPEVMQVIMSQDPGAIQSNPKIMQLLQNPKMQILIQQAGQKIMGQGGVLQP